MLKYVFGFLATLAFTHTATAESLTPQSIQMLFQQKPARAVVNELYDDGRLDRIYDRIGKGSAEWIQLAPVIARGTDAHSSESLGISLAYALPRNPQAVLSVVTDDFYSPIGISRVCSAPFIEPTEKTLARYLKTSSRALTSIRFGGNAEKAQKCLAELKKAASSMEKKP